MNLNFNRFKVFFKVHLNSINLAALATTFEMIERLAPRFNIVAEIFPLMPNFELMLNSMTRIFVHLEKVNHF